MAEKLSLARHLANRRQEVKERHRHQESFPGTGWHPDDPLSPQRQKKTPLSERPVAFQDDDQVHLVNECAEQAIAAVRKFAEYEAVTSQEFRIDALARGIDGYTRREEDVTVLSLPSSKWNDVAHAMAAAGIDTCLADAYPPTGRRKKQ